MTRTVLYTIAAACACASVVMVATAKAPGAQCHDGFFPVGHRCCPSVSGDGDHCGAARTCPPPLVMEGGLCIAAPTRVRVPETTITVGPSDWEADKLVQPRTIHVLSFDMDAFEITAHDAAPGAEDDPARAQGGLDRAAVVAVCASRGGRLPTEDEWIAAAAGVRGTRYPWGDTGAVCRRAAWGLSSGPCTHGARLPDTVGAHTDGDTVTGIHDLAGNVAEWVDAPDGVVMGGSFRTELASELRVWARRVVDPGTKDPSIGGRCAYDLR